MIRSAWNNTIRALKRFWVGLVVCMTLLIPERLCAIGQSGNNNPRQLNMETYGLLLLIVVLLGVIALCCRILWSLGANQKQEEKKLRLKSFFTLLLVLEVGNLAAKVSPGGKPTGIKHPVNTSQQYFTAILTELFILLVLTVLIIIKVKSIGGSRKKEAYGQADVHKNYK